MRAAQLLLLSGAKLAPASLVLDFVNDSYTGGNGTLAGLLTCARTGTSCTDLMPDSASGAAYTTYAANVLRRNANGLLVETTRVNRVLNSSAPVTQTASTSATGSWVLWVNGAGSATIAAGTAVGTGWGVATQGNPVFLNITTSGTTVITVAGALNAMQFENGAAPSSFILTAGAVVTRAAEVVTLTSNVVDLAEGTILAEWMEKQGTLSNTSYVWNNRVTANDETYLARLNTGVGRVVTEAGGVAQPNLSSLATLAVNTIYKAGYSYKSGELHAAFSTDAAGLDGVPAALPTGTPAFALGSRGGVSQLNGFIRKLSYSPTRSSKAALQKWARAA